MPTAPPDLALTPFLVVGLVAVAAGALVWWQRRRSGARPDDLIRLLATRALGGKRLLAIVEVERERFLLGLTDDSVTCLGRLASSSSDTASGRDSTPGQTHSDGGERTWRLKGGRARSEEKSTPARALPRAAAPQRRPRRAADDESAPAAPATGEQRAATNEQPTRHAAAIAPHATSIDASEPRRGRGDAPPSEGRASEHAVEREAGAREGCAGTWTSLPAPRTPLSPPPPGRHAIGIAILTIVATLLLTAAPAHAALPQLSLEVGGNGDGLSTSIQLMLLFTLLSFAPAILIGVSAFVRIVIVLAFVRQAVGTQQMPPNQVIIALALFLTFFVMMPTLRQVNQDAVQPYLLESTPPVEALERGFQPLRAFMLRQTREKDLALFLGISRHARPDTAAEVPPEVVIPAFMISELKTAFQISFMVYIPFLVLDMVVASILTSMGMITLPPVLISLPFKLMIFVLVDGWNLLISSLIRSFQ